MIVDPELKPLTEPQRKFIGNMAYEGMDKIEAYSVAFGQELTSYNRQNIREKSNRLFYKPHVNNYYQAVMEEVREKEVKKGVWTKEVSTQKLVRLIEKAEQDIYGDEELGLVAKQLTMSRLNAIVLPVKELNTMNGFNQTNINVDGCIVQIYGEDKIPD